MLRLIVDLDKARSQVCHGDLLLFRRRGLISAFGRGVHSHAAKAAWLKGELACVELREWHGGRIVSLESQVRRYPGRIDVFETNPDDRWANYDRLGAMAQMLTLAGRPYNYRGILYAALLHLPVVRLCVRPDLDDQRTNGRPMFCSQAVAAAERIGGRVDPVPNLADCLVEPADLARSPFYRYRFTLGDAA